MENKTERLVILLTPTEKKQLLEKAKENNTTLSLLVRKRIFDYDNWFKGINTIKEIEKLENVSKMNDWETIEKIVNTLPQWDVIKLIIGIQEELKCAKEDNLYQLRKNKDLQNRIDKAIEFTKKERKRENNTQPKDILDQQFKNGFTSALAQVEDILKESGE